MQDWYDDRLQWNASDFDGLEDIVMKPERIWLPELALMNGYVAADGCIFIKYTVPPKRSPTFLSLTRANVVQF